MKCPKCGMNNIFDVSALRMSDFLSFYSHACLKCGWMSDEIIQVERLNERELTDDNQNRQRTTQENP